MVDNGTVWTDCDVFMNELKPTANWLENTLVILVFPSKFPNLILIINGAVTSYWQVRCLRSLWAKAGNVGFP